MEGWPDDTRMCNDFGHRHDDYFAEHGAALGPVMTGIPPIQMENGKGKGPCLVWCSLDYEIRAAITVDTL